MTVARFAIEQAAEGRLVATGELSFETAAHALRQGDAHLKRGGTWVVDLAGVESGDSAGLAVLIEWLATARASGAAVRYERVPEQMLAIARISDIDELLTVDS
jgi:phospholipid transport system transporter-binding protein